MNILTKTVVLLGIILVKFHCAKTQSQKTEVFDAQAFQQVQVLREQENNPKTNLFYRGSGVHQTSATNIQTPPREIYEKGDTTYVSGNTKFSYKPNSQVVHSDTYSDRRKASLSSTQNLQGQQYDSTEDSSLYQVENLEESAKDLPESSYQKTQAQANFAGNGNWNDHAVYLSGESPLENATVFQQKNAAHDPDLRFGNVQSKRMRKVPIVLITIQKGQNGLPKERANSNSKIKSQISDNNYKYNNNQASIEEDSLKTYSPVQTDVSKEQTVSLNEFSSTNQAQNIPDASRKVIHTNTATDGNALRYSIPQEGHYSLTRDWQPMDRSQIQHFESKTIIPNYKQEQSNPEFGTYTQRTRENQENSQLHENHEYPLQVHSRSRHPPLHQSNRHHTFGSKTGIDSGLGKESSVKSYGGIHINDGRQDQSSQQQPESHVYQQNHSSNRSKIQHFESEAIVPNYKQEQSNTEFRTYIQSSHDNPQNSQPQRHHESPIQVHSRSRHFPLHQSNRHHTFGIKTGIDSDLGNESSIKSYDGIHIKNGRQDQATHLQPEGHAYQQNQSSNSITSILHRQLTFQNVTFPTKKENHSHILPHVPSETFLQTDTSYLDPNSNNVHKYSGEEKIISSVNQNLNQEVRMQNQNYNYFIPNNDKNLMESTQTQSFPNQQMKIDQFHVVNNDGRASRTEMVNNFQVTPMPELIRANSPNGYQEMISTKGLEAIASNPGEYEHSSNQNVQEEHNEKFYFRMPTNRKNPQNSGYVLFPLDDKYTVQNNGNSGRGFNIVLDKLNSAYDPVKKLFTYQNTDSPEANSRTFFRHEDSGNKALQGDDVLNSKKETISYMNSDFIASKNNPSSNIGTSTSPEGNRHFSSTYESYNSRPENLHRTSNHHNSYSGKSENMNQNEEMIRPVNYGMFQQNAGMSRESSEEQTETFINLPIQYGSNYELPIKYTNGEAYETHVELQVGKNAENGRNIQQFQSSHPDYVNHNSNGNTNKHSFKFTKENQNEHSLRFKKENQNEHSLKFMKENQNEHSLKLMKENQNEHSLKHMKENQNEHSLKFMKENPNSESISLTHVEKPDKSYGNSPIEVINQYKNGNMKSTEFQVSSAETSDFKRDFNKHKNSHHRSKSSSPRALVLVLVSENGSNLNDNSNTEDITSEYAFDSSSKDISELLGQESNAKKLLETLYNSPPRNIKQMNSDDSNKGTSSKPQKN